jgi:hypothetical protein
MKFDVVVKREGRALVGVEIFEKGKVIFIPIENKKQFNKKIKEAGK